MQINDKTEHTTATANNGSSSSSSVCAPTVEVPEPESSGLSNEPAV